MSAWTTERFRTPLILKRSPVPQITQGDQLLLKVKASSVNPIDEVMTKGYGNEALTLTRQIGTCSIRPASRLPLIAGRDCSAQVVDVGKRVQDFRVGDQVIAVIPADWPGAHAEYVLAPAYGVAKKPGTTGHVEAAAMCYTACTVWSALVSIARLNPKDASGNRVLIHGGSGGVGTTAIQLLRAWGVDKVVATCSAKNLALVNGLGARALDYNSKTVKEEIIAEGPYDVILSCVDTDLSRWSDNIMGIWRNCVHVSVVSPLLGDTDRYGLPLGIASTAAKYFMRSYESAIRGRWFFYGFFYPHGDCLKQLSELIDEGKVKPIIDKVFTFDEAPKAYAHVAKLIGGGKTVIDYEPKPSFNTPEVPPPGI